MRLYKAPFASGAGLAASLVLAVSGRAEIVSFNMALDGWQETPANTTVTATGTASATLDTATNLFSWNITYGALSAPEIAAHFHGAATVCLPAGVAVGLPLGSPKIGSATVTAGQASDILAGRWYINIHSTAFPGGEIRGQVLPAPLSDQLPPVPLGSLRVHLQPLATGMVAPNWGCAAPGHPNRIMVADQTGVLWAVDRTSGAKSVFLDVSARLVPLGIFGPGTFDERGLLGVAFHPSYTTNGLLYTFTSEPIAGPPDFTTQPAGIAADCQSVIAEWAVPDPTNPASVADPLSRREILRFDKPQFNHNGGCMEFGPDGLLYISVGDGGGADDQDGTPFIGGVPTRGHTCLGNGQDVTTVLGKILRIDPLGSNSANGRYGNPATNPYVGIFGLDEIYAIGLRNPWRMGFDTVTGTLYCGDVGQNDIEELNVILLGGNYGWRHKEGSLPFIFNGTLNGYTTDRAIALPGGLSDPIAQYDHDDGISIIGGFVNRGTNVPYLSGRYIFAEFGRFFDQDGRLFYLDVGNVIREFQLTARPLSVGQFVLGMGRDAQGEVYVMVNDIGTPFGTTGAVLRVGPGRGDTNCDGVVNVLDINPFVLALADPAAYAAQFPNCTTEQADIDGSGTADVLDINPFVALLSGG
ncbi:Quinoprotein glucose dehydrogenase B precursor [Phycisphaerae bacterium RAS1]|nr:Quinoprotein glucose dehydrogenase B precursor [Phycisphaerae bacterium RAS1]